MVRFLTFYILEFGEKFQLIANLHPLIKPAFFRQITNPVLQLRIDMAAKQFNVAGIGRGDVDDHPNGCRFSGGVGPEQAEYSACPDGQTEFAYGFEVAKTLANPIQLYCYLACGHIVGDCIEWHLSSVARNAAGVTTEKSSLDIQTTLLSDQAIRLAAAARDPPATEAVKELLDQNITQVTAIRRLGRGQSLGSTCNNF